MRITVQVFSFLSQAIGQRELTLELSDDATVSDALAELHRRFPVLKEAEKTTLLAVGVDFTDRTARLREGDILSLMPPLQGGSDEELVITNQPIDPAEAQPTTSTETGGVVVFWGVVRNREDAKPIRALEYSTYHEMAEHQFEKIIATAKQKWPIQRLRVIHRLGEIPVGEASLLVRVESAHRAEAFAAAQWIIDELKAKVPIWKRGVE